MPRSRPSAVTILLVGVGAAAVSYLLAAGCALQGRNYDGWARTFFLGIVVAAVADMAALVTRPRPTAARLGVAGACVVAIVSLFAASNRWWGDGRAPSTVPSVLAWLAFAAIVVGATAWAAPARRR